MLQKFQFILLFLLVYSHSFAQNATTAFEQLKQSEQLQHAQIGVSVKELSTGKVIFENDAHQLFVPASIQKLITTGAAYATLNPQYSFTTTVYTEGRVVSGVLNGNIVVEGNGDPTFCHTEATANLFYQEVLAALSYAGIKEIKGQVLVMPFIELNAPNQTWLYEDIANYYGSPAHGLNFMQNTYTVQLQQHETLGKATSIVSVTPKVPYEFECNVVIASANSGDEAYILGAPFSNERIIVGSIPAGKGTFSIKGAIANPYAILEDVLLEQIIAGGVKVAENENLTIENIKTELFTQTSDELGAIIKTTNSESNNLYAEGILNALGEGKSSQGIAAITSWIKERNLPIDEIAIFDGSGLSKKDALTPNFVTEWLIDLNNWDPAFKEDRKSVV